MQIDPEFFVLGVAARSKWWPVTFAGASSIAENGNAYFECVSIFLEVNFAGIWP